LTTEPISDYHITDHARFEMGRRGIGENVVADVLRSPEQRLPVRPGRVVLQSRVSVAGKQYLVRVVVDVDREPAAVVTVYRTTRIGKYWRESE
jgi:hypothetical protein